MIDGLKGLNAERNRAVEPANLIPARLAADRCSRPVPPLTGAEVSVCETAEVRQAIEEMKKYRAD